MRLQRSGRKLECIPKWESIMGGVYDLGEEASYEGAVESLTITRPIKPLGHQQHHCPHRRHPGHPSKHSCDCADRPGRHGHHRTRTGF